MRTKIAVLLLFFGWTVCAQTDRKATPVKPSLLVAQSKKTAGEFKNYDLFTVDVTINQKAVDALNPYDLLIVKKRQLDAIATERPNKIRVNIPRKDHSEMNLELVRVDLLSDDFQIQLSSGRQVNMSDERAFYRGIIKGQPQSVASISFFDENLSGIISAPDLGNFSLEKDAGTPGGYKLHHAVKGTKLGEFYCAVEDMQEEYVAEELTVIAENAPGEKCTKVFFEVDHDIYTDKGGVTPVVNFVTGLFNEVATLYANENIRIEISEIFIWDNSSPYQGGTSLQMLNQFQNIRTSFNGDLAQLLSYQSSGGIAVVSGLCHPVSAAKMSFASIKPAYAQFPNYSFSVLVVAHELGHLFGSQHTHACVWNGNNTAIDGCAGFVEGSCPNDAGVPTEGGTIMSYCHLTGQGTNFSLGFGPQPGNLIRNRIANSTCLETCVIDDDGPEDDPPTTVCQDQEFFLTLVLDSYPTEILWRLLDANNRELYSGGPYTKPLAYEELQQAFCLKPGGYALEIIDTYGDGLCCNYGQGYYFLKDKGGRLIAGGSQFGSRQRTGFFVDGKEKPPHDNCTEIDFNSYSIETYGGVQDVGTFEVSDDGHSLKLENNAWKAIHLEYTVTPNTHLAFEFASTEQGEIHAIGFDKDDIPSGSRTFHLFGTQPWGIADFSNYLDNNSWQQFVIPVGQYYTGEFVRLFFVSDDDFGTTKGNSYFKNVKIFEGEDCYEPSLDENFGELPKPSIANRSGKSIFKVAPNPASDQITVDFFSDRQTTASLKVIDLHDRVVLERGLLLTTGLNGFSVDLSTFPGAGLYILSLETKEERWAKKITVFE